MRLNLSHLRGGHSFPAGAAGIAGATSNGGALSAPVGDEISRGKPGQSNIAPLLPPGSTGNLASGLNLKSEPAPAAPAVPRLVQFPETQQRRSAPAAPVAPAQKSNVRTISAPAGVTGLLAANDSGLPATLRAPMRACESGSDDQGLSQRIAQVCAREIRAGPLVLTFEVDSGLATCIDPVSASLAEAVADIRRQFPGRVGRVWRNGQELT